MCPVGQKAMSSRRLLRWMGMNESSSPKVCVVCSAELRGKQERYCSARCKNTATKRRYRERVRSGETIPRKQVAQLIAEKYGPELQRIEVRNDKETRVAHEELARVVREREHFKDRAYRLEFELERERKRYEREYQRARLFAQSYVVLVRHTETADVIAKPLRERLAPYLKSGDNPWA